ncbi:MAG: N-acetylmuramoyl-L-alanine amidase [Verrucomicrobiota bacterium]
MRSVVRILPLLAALAAPPGSDAAASTRGSDSSSSRTGSQYVRLTDWARANEFTIHHWDSDKTLELSNRVAHLEFNTDPRQDSRNAILNGVAVKLAFPLLIENNRVFITQSDLENTIGPVLSPPSNPGGLKIRTICIDPGHGGSDPGFQVGSRDEKKYTLLLAQEVRDQLNKLGFRVVLTRGSDSSLKLGLRPEIAREHNADLFVSLHFNSAPQHNEVRGVEVYCMTPAGAFSTNAGGDGDTRWCAGNRNDEKNMLLAWQMQRSLIRQLPVEDRGVHRARFQVLREATMPAILIEGGFMSNPAEGRKIFDPSYRKQMAKAIVDGILAYKKAVKG